MTLQAEVLADSPWGFWAFDSLAASQADLSGNGHTATLSNTGAALAAAIVGEFANSIKLNGSDHLSVPFPTMPTNIPTPGLCFELWMDQLGTQAAHPIGDANSQWQQTIDLGWNDGNDGNGFTAGAIGLFYRGTSNTYTVRSTYLGTGIDDGLPHHLVINIYANTYEVYLDGVKLTESSSANNYVNNFANYTQDFGMGAANWNAVGQGWLMPMVGRVQAFAIYTGNLSATRVAAHYTAGTASAGSTVTANGFANTQSFGTAIATLNISIIGIANTQTFGPLSVILNTSAIGFANAQSFGAASLLLNLQATGFANNQGFGSSTLTLNTSSISLLNAQSFGTPLLSSSGINVPISSFANTQSFGASTLTQTLQAVGFANTQTWGTPFFLGWHQQNAIDSFWVEAGMLTLFENLAGFPVVNGSPVNSILLNTLLQMAFPVWQEESVQQQSWSKQSAL